MAVPTKGTWANLLDIDRWVRANGLQACTNPQFLDKTGPTPDGVLSNEIFGITQESRRETFAYIDLEPYHYMTPLAAVKLASYDGKLSDCLFARGTYKLGSDGKLVEDENGDSGPEFVYKIWGKVKISDKTSVTTKEVQKFYEQPRDKLFITKYPVIPAFYRDVNNATNSLTKSSNILNKYYSNIIAYTQTMKSYNAGFASMTRMTQARVQSIIVDIYKELMVAKVKGTPSKFGMLRRSMGGKNLPFTSRLVITAINYNQESYDRVAVKMGYAAIPLDYVCSMFLPFMIYHLKNHFDARFIRAGKVPFIKSPGAEPEYITFNESFDENQITAMITKFINSPSTRFDEVITPPDTNGNTHKLQLVGRYHKDQTSFVRNATITDILYICAVDVVEDKHVFITRYPLDNPNGQFPARITVTTTTNTEPVQIGERTYEFFPICEGDPANQFLGTCQFSNTMLSVMGGDFDGDQVSVRPVYTKEANAEAEAQIKSNAYLLNVQGKFMRPMERDFCMTAYCTSNCQYIPNGIIGDINAEAPVYAI